MSASAASAASGSVLFDARLRPHRSLSDAGFRWLMAALAAAFLGVGAAFFAAGAWPVIGFCGLELALVYLFFRLNFRDLGRYETIRLTQTELEVRRVAPDGSAERASFQPYWLKVAIENAPGRSSRLVLSSHGRALDVGSFLAPEEREELARALADALARQRRAPGAEA
ncbi:MAG: DUF2244 domain-containing protein [Rhodospirillales bacterium]